MKTKELIGLIALIGITLYFGGTLISYFKTGDTFGIVEYLLIAGLLVAWIELITWGSRKEVKRDEMGKEILKSSHQLSYRILFIALFILWMIDYLVLNNRENYLFFIALCLAYLTNPVVQFILVKKQVD